MTDTAAFLVGWVIGSLLALSWWGTPSYERALRWVLRRWPR